MNILVLYDSTHGNTEKIARAIGDAVGARTEVISEVRPFGIGTDTLLFVGSPTQGGRATPTMIDFISALPDEALKGVRTAVFDTRFALSQHGLGLKFVMKTIGFAAPKMAKDLAKKGAQIVAEPEGFIVTDTKGPLDSGELERARAWAQGIVQKARQQAT